jgi:CheY-like chemotaxis protein
MNLLARMESFRLAELFEQQSSARRNKEIADEDTDRIRRLHCRILVVDDDDLFRPSFAERLRAVYDAYVEEAEDALMAVQKLAEKGAFDIVLLDVDMPEEDGIAACLKMRSSGILGRIVLMSQDLQNGDRAREIGEEFFEKSDDIALEAILVGCKGDRSRG